MTVPPHRVRCIAELSVGSEQSSGNVLGTLERVKSKNDVHTFMPSVLRQCQQVGLDVGTSAYDIDADAALKAERVDKRGSGWFFLALCVLVKSTIGTRRGPTRHS